jgi:Fe-Mn family superoxide dismutase
MRKGISRRDFLTYSLAASAGAFLIGIPGRRSAHAQATSPDRESDVSAAPAHDEKESAMPFTLPPLPYDKGALAPYLSAETLEYHYGKHHQTYVNNLNKLTEGKPEAKKSLEKIIMTAAPGGLFNNAAQVWNHTFYWNCMKPGGGGEPDGALRQAIERDFESFAKFKEELTTAATTLFGSGWAWLALDGKKLRVVQTKDADLPMKHDQTALLTIDVWEHAYYIDYRNARPKYIEAFLDHLVNWDFAAQNLKKT